MSSRSEIASGIDRSRLYGRIAWRILPILMAAQILAFLDRANVGFAQLQMKDSLSLSNTAYGLGAGIFFIGYFLFEIPSNIILHRVGARRWFTRILITWGIATALMSLVESTSAFYALRFIIGAAEAGFAPGTQLYFSRWFPDSYRGRCNGVFLVTIPLSFLIGGPIAGMILGPLDGVMGWHGWQWLFFIEGSATVALAPVLYKLLTDSPSDAQWLSSAERAAVEADIYSQGEGAADGRPFGRRSLGFSAAFFLLLCGMYGITFWLPLLLQDSGVLDPRRIGWLSALPFVGATLGVLLLSRWSDRHRRRRSALIGCALAAAIGLALTASAAHSLVLSLVGLIMAATGIQSAVPVLWAAIARSYAGRSAAVAFAFINSCGNLAGFCSPYLVGYIADATGSPRPAMYILSLLLAASAGAMALLVKSDEGTIT